MTRPIALTISVLDPTGVVGIAADLAEFAGRNVHGAAAACALTIPDRGGIKELIHIPAELLAKQLTGVLAGAPVAAVKTGLGLDGERAAIVADHLHRFHAPRYVLDCSFRSASSFMLARADDIDVVKKRLLPLATVVFANRREVESLTGMAPQNEDEMVKAAGEIRAAGAGAVVILNGIEAGEQTVDLFFDGTQPMFLRAPRQRGRRIQGAGGRFAAAVVADLALGTALPDAVVRAKRDTDKAIQAAAAGASPDILEREPGEG